MTIGTEWVALGKGSSIRDLLEAVESAFPTDSLNQKAKNRAVERLRSFSRDYVTSLRLTGQALQPYDLERIAAVGAADRMGVS